jgi:uncharacterized protein YciI
MFIISLTYKCDLSEVDKYLEEHVSYLQEQYKKRLFIASGRKVPRTGGIILAMTEDITELQRAITMDPFYINNIAEYEITEFIPSMVAPGFECLQNPI